MNQIAHSPPVFNPFSRNRAIIFSVIALALTALSFHGALDNLAFSKIEQLTKETFGLLLVSRGINAAVSVLQTIEFEIPFIPSAQIGQVLDPINDAAERLSVALLLAIGSLFLQDILLKIVSGWIFKWGFLAITVITAISLILAQLDRVRIAFVTTFGISHLTLAQIQGFVIKTFVVATVFRFIVPTFAATSFLVSQALIAPEIRQHTGELEQHAEGLSELGAQISEARDEVINEQESQEEILTDDEAGDSVSNEEVEPVPASSPDHAAAAKDVQILGEQRAQLEKKLASLQGEKEKLTSSINEKENSGWTDRIRKLTGDPEKMLAEADARVEHTVAEIEPKEWELACIEHHTTGEKCESFLAERRKQALGELKTQLVTQQTEQQERLKSKLEERREHIATIGDETEDEPDSGLLGGIIEAPIEFFFGHSAEEIEDAKARLKDLDHELDEHKELAERTVSDLACIELRIAGQHCDSHNVDVHVQSVFDTLKARLVSDLRPLLADLASSRGERTRLAELGNLTAERTRIEDDINETERLVAQKDLELECAEQRVDGEDCNTLIDDGVQIVLGAKEAAGKGLTFAGETAGRVVSSVAAATSRAFSKVSRGVMDRFKAIFDSAHDMVTRMVTILILVVIENIVLPLIFLAIALKGSVPIARGVMRIATSVREDTREALTALDQALPGRRN